MEIKEVRPKIKLDDIYAFLMEAMRTGTPPRAIREEAESATRNWERFENQRGA